MKDKHTATLRPKTVISSCFFWSKLIKCGPNPFWANSHGLTDYFHKKTKSRAELWVSLTKFCSLVEEHTLFSIYSVLLAFFQSFSLPERKSPCVSLKLHLPPLPCSCGCLSLPLLWLFPVTNKQHVLADVPLLSRMVYVVQAFGWN